MVAARFVYSHCFDADSDDEVRQSLARASVLELIDGLEALHTLLTQEPRDENLTSYVILQANTAFDADDYAGGSNAWVEQFAQTVQHVLASRQAELIAIASNYDADAVAWEKDEIYQRFCKTRAERIWNYIQHSSDAT